MEVARRGFFYDEQVRRYLLQFIRIFSDIKIQSGEDENGISTQSRVPVRYADLSRMVAHIINDGNQNTVLPSPMMTVWIASLEMSPDRRNDPAFVGKIQRTERKFDDEQGDYTTEAGQKYTVERYMPVPYDLTFQLDIWTTNTTTKLQIVEQIASIFNPSLQLQQNSNQLDWSSIFEVELTDVIFTNRTLPQGTETERDIASLTFKVPIWINPPAKVKQQKVIHQIVTNVFSVQDVDDLDINDISFQDHVSQQIITPGNHRVSLGVDSAPNELILLNKGGLIDENLSWTTLLERYGEIQNGISTITLKLDPDIESEDGDIIGRISLIEDQPNLLKFDVDIDTLPNNTQKPINSIIDPRTELPDNGLPPALIGQRYLLLSDDFQDTNNPIINLNHDWNIIAYENDIIEYGINGWFVSFDSNSSNKTEYVTSIENQQQYSFSNNTWNFTYLGEYTPGYWRIAI